ncbi:unnamed protein product [Meloidogyne enterolobii]|uniref:Uncharacterized protein n=1 Tax=Meloidogyne enterolobii TaxID=390850 RepID=A0ACB0YK85_MELEN
MKNVWLVGALFVICFSYRERKKLYCRLFYVSMHLHFLPYYISMPAVLTEGLI